MSTNVPLDGGSQHKGKRDRVDRGMKILARCGGAAGPVLPRRRELEEELVAHGEAEVVPPVPGPA